MAVVRNISYFLVSSVLSKPLGFLLSFTVARSLGPADFGVWVTLMLIISYGPIACLGTVETLLKQVPYFLGRGETRHIHEVENSVLGSVILAGAFVVVLACLAPLVLPFIAPGIRAPLVAMMLVTAATNYFSAYFYNRLVAYENFKLVGLVDLLRSVLALLFIGGLAWTWGLPGAVAGYLLHEFSVCLTTIAINLRMHGAVGVGFKRELLARAVRIGFPITLLWWVLTLTGTVDRVVIGSLLGPLSVGHYGLGTSLVTILYLVPIVVGRVLYPKVNKQMGQNAGPEAMQRIVLAPTLALGTLLANLQLGLLLIMPLLYNQFLPKYQPGLIAGQILIFGSYFGCLTRNGANYLIAANHEHVFLKYIFVTLATNVALDVALVKAGFGIAGVAVGTSIAGTLLTTLVWRRVLTHLKFPPRRVWTTILHLYLPNLALVGTMAVMWLIYRQAFQVFNWPTLALGLVGLIVINGGLYCLPVYRDEMHGWRKRLSKANVPFDERAALADTIGRV